jgi:hypothetical protein
VYRLFGLSRDPFAPVGDGSLYWEEPVRADARERALRALRGGRGIWVWGRSGSGRGMFLARVAEDIAMEGRTALAWDGSASTDPVGILARLLDTACGTKGAGDLLALAEALYSRLIEAFSRSGTVVVMPGTEPLAPGALGEAEILGGLRIAGQPLAALLLCGEEGSPLGGLEEIHLPIPSPGDLREFLVHRAAACGRADLLPARDLARITEKARGFSDALSLARTGLARLAFCRGADDNQVAQLAGEHVNRLLPALEPFSPSKRF